MANVIETILKSCEGVEYKRIKHTQSRWSSSQPSYSERFYKVGELVIPRDTYIEINATATKGTVGRVVDIEIETWGERYPDRPVSGREPNEFLTYNVTIIYEVDSPNKKGRINSDHANALVGTHQTKYVRKVKTHDKVEIKNPVNKFKQEMQRGDWVIGVARKRLKIGRITRWTNHNVWAVLGDDLDDTTKEFRFDSIRETFTMLDDAHAQLTMAVLKGWDGR